MKEAVREAVRKEQIVPGKIRVISIFLALIVATVVTTAVVLGDVQRKDRAVQEHLAEEVLRFHVLANSDSRKDQAVKLEVRDAVDSQCGGDDMLFPGSDLWRCHISCRKLQDPEDRTGRSGRT